MKFIFFIFLFFGASALANPVIPKSFGIQYSPISISGEPFINYTFAIDATDFPSMTFSSLSAKVINNKSNKLLVEPRVVYGKSSGTKIIGSDVITFSLQGLEALYNLKNLKTSSIIFEGDDSSSFSVNLSTLCRSNPENFLNLTGNDGCDPDQNIIDTKIKELESSEEKPVKSLICNDIEEIKPLVDLFCSSDLKVKAETDFNCTLKCN